MSTYLRTQKLCDNQTTRESKKEQRRRGRTNYLPFSHSKIATQKQEEEREFYQAKHGFPLRPIVMGEDWDSIKKVPKPALWMRELHRTMKETENINIFFEQKLLNTCYQGGEKVKSFLSVIGPWNPLGITFRFQEKAMSHILKIFLKHVSVVRNPDANPQLEKEGASTCFLFELLPTISTEYFYYIFVIKPLIASVPYRHLHCITTEDELHSCKVAFDHIRKTYSPNFLPLAPTLSQ